MLNFFFKIEFIEIFNFYFVLKIIVFLLFIIFSLTFSKFSFFNIRECFTKLIVIINELDFVSFGASFGIFFFACFGLLFLVFNFKINQNLNVEAVVKQRKYVSLQLMYFMILGCKFVIAMTLCRYFVYECFLLLTNNFVVYFDKTAIPSILSSYQKTIFNVNFNNEFNMFLTFCECLILLTSTIILQSSYKFLQTNNRAILEFPIIIMLAVFFLSILLKANDLFVVFIATIGFSINTYVLILSNPDDKNCCEAGIKYFYLSALSSGLIAFSLWLAYLMFLTLNFFAIEDTLKEWDIIFDNSIGLLACFVSFLIFGFFFKLAAFPCHLWAAAVYEGSPQPIMAFFVLPVKISVLIFFFKFFCLVLKDAYLLIAYLLWFSTIFSMITGALAALVEKRIKKFFAYSSINQMGFLLIGPTIGTTSSLTAAFNYLIIYVVMNIVVFVILLNTFEKKNNRQLIYFTDLTYFANRNMNYAVMFTIVLFSMAGIPPLLGFFGKFYVLLEAMNQHYYSIVIIGLATTLISTYYYLKIIKHLLFDKFYTNKHATFYNLNFLVENTKNIYWALIFSVTFLIFGVLLSENLLNISSGGF